MKTLSILCVCVCSCLKGCFSTHTHDHMLVNLEMMDYMQNVFLILGGTCSSVFV